LRGDVILDCNDVGCTLCASRLGNEASRRCTASPLMPAPWAALTARSGISSRVFRRGWVTSSRNLNKRSLTRGNLPRGVAIKGCCYIGVTAGCQTPLMTTEVRTSRVSRTWLEKLVWKRAYETKIFDERREVCGRGQTPEASQEAAERQWVAELPADEPAR
jgi:hypothetical protein